MYITESRLRQIIREEGQVEVPKINGKATEYKVKP